MRIAILANASNVHTVRWANALAESGFQVEVLSAHGFSPALSHKVHLHSLRLSRKWGYLLNVRRLRRLLRTIQPEVLHAHYASGYGTLGRLSAFHPFVLSVWGADVYDFPRKSPLHRRLVIRNLRCADRTCSTSFTMAQQCQKLCPLLTDIRVISFGTKLDVFVPQPKQSHAEEIVIGTVKTLSAKYGIDTLLRGFATCRSALQRDVPELAARLRLRIVGAGPLRRSLGQLAVTLGIADATIFVGAVPHSAVPDELREMDIFVAVSRLDSESFGVAVVEASACGLPVVVSDAGGLPEVVRDGQTGIVIPRDDPPALAAALQDLIQNDSRRRQLGEMGRRHVAANYDWRNNVDQMMAVYRELLGQKTQPLLASA